MTRPAAPGRPPPAWRSRTSLHTATLLLDGEVLVASGIAGALTPKAELYNVGLGFSSDWQPEIDMAPLRLISGNRLSAHRLTFPGNLTSFRREHSRFIQQLPDRAVAQPRKRSGCFSAGRSSLWLVRHQLYLSPGKSLSLRPGSSDRLYQRHPKHCQACDRRETSPLA